MTSLADISAALTNLEKWRDCAPRTRNEELARVNWTYDGDKHVEAEQGLDVILMGFNPGAGRGATPTKLAPGEKRYRTYCQKLSEGLGKGFVMAELVPMSTQNEAELQSRFGNLDDLICAGAPVNMAVIKYHKPKVVFQIGLGHLGSGLIDQSQKMTVAAMQMADMKVCAQRS